MVLVKMNIDTDTQWAYWKDTEFYKKNELICKAVRQPRRTEKPNKKYYDPRAWLREGEKTLVEG